MPGGLGSAPWALHARFTDAEVTYMALMGVHRLQLWLHTWHTHTMHQWLVIAEPVRRNVCVFQRISLCVSVTSCGRPTWGGPLLSVMPAKAADGGLWRGPEVGPEGLKPPCCGCMGGLGSGWA